MQKECAEAERALAKAAAKDDEIAALEAEKGALLDEIARGEAAMASQREEIGAMVAGQVREATKKTLGLERQVRKLEVALSKANAARPAADLANEGGGASPARATDSRGAMMAGGTQVDVGG